MKFSKIAKKTKILFFLPFILMLSSFLTQNKKEESSIFDRKKLVEKEIKNQNQIYYTQWIEESKKEKKYHQEKKALCKLKKKEKQIACIDSEVHTLTEYKKNFDYHQRYIANNSFSYKDYFDTYVENQIIYKYMKEKNLLIPIKDLLIEKTIMDADLKFFLQENYKDIQEKEYETYYKQMSLFLKKAPKWKNLKYEDRKNIKFNYKKTLFYNKLKQEYRIQKNDQWEDNHIQLFINGQYKKKDESKWIFKILYSQDKQKKPFVINIKMLDKGLKELLKMKATKNKKSNKDKKNQQLRKEYLDYFLFEKLARIYFNTDPLFKKINYKDLKVFLIKIFQIHLHSEKLKRDSQKKKDFLEQVKQYKEKKNIYTYDANLLN